MSHATKFKNVNGVYYTQTLFFEMSKEPQFVLYTLKPYDYKGYPSLKRLYLEMEDPTEYEFANAYLDGWEHWQKLIAVEWFLELVTQWRIELDLKLTARAYKEIAKDAIDPLSKSKHASNKYILESLRKLRSGQDEKPGRGRPSKDYIRSVALEEAAKQMELDDDWTRIKAVN